MGLHHVTPTHVEFACPECGTVDEFAIDTLLLGSERDADVIRLGACSSCPATRPTYHLLMRTWDTTPALHHGTRFDLDRRLVNSLAQLLRASGRIHPTHRAAVLAELSDPPDMPAST